MNKQTLIAVIITAIVVALGTSYFQGNFTIEKKTTPVANNVISENSEKAKEEPKSDVISWKTFSHSLFTIDYPSNYSVNIEQVGSVEIVTISNEKGSVKISQMDLSFGAPGPAAPSDPENELPKNMVVHGYNGDINSALFYKNGDNATMNELKKIQETIKLIN